MRLLILLVAIISSSCATTAPPVAAELPLPPPVELPRIRAESLMCLTDATYAALVRRDRLQAERIRTLESIIRSTRK